MILGAVLAVAGAAATPAGAPAAALAGARASQVGRLLQQVRIGEATYRDDLVSNALAALRMVAPDDPGVLLDEVRFALHEGRPHRAQEFRTRLCKPAPQSPDCARANMLVRLAGPDHARLQEAELLLAAGNNTRALEVYRQLFGTAPPDFSTALQYWTAFGGIEDQRNEAIRQLQALDRRYPGNVQLRQTLVRFLFGQNRPAEALQVLGELAANPQARGAAAETEFAYLSGLRATPGSIADWQRFLHRYPGSPLTGQARQRLDAQQQRMRDPAWQAGLRGAALLAQGRNQAAAQALRQALARYPDDLTFNGDLGFALMRAGDHAGAARAFEKALALNQDSYHAGKWRTLIAHNRYWALLGEGDAALAERDYVTAKTRYAAARRLEPRDAEPLLGLARVARARGDDATAANLLAQARKADPASIRVVRELVDVLRDQKHPQRALAVLTSLPAAQQQDLAGLARRVRGDVLDAEIRHATAAGNTRRVVGLLQHLHGLQPDDPWVAYRLAKAQAAAGHPDAGEAVFQALVAAHRDDPQAAYAYALYLASIHRDRAATAALGAVPVASWNDGMHKLDARMHHNLILARADALRADGDEAAAERLLLDQHDSDDQLTVAGWVQQRGDNAYAERLYRDVLAREPSNAEAGLGYAETLIAEGRRNAARQFMQRTPPAPPPQDYNARRRLANIWFDVGDPDRAAATFAALDREDPTDALLLRDSARVATARGQRQRALVLYARAMRAAHLIAPEADSAYSNDGAMTWATRAQAGDGWLDRSLRSDVATLYESMNPTVTVSQEYDWRSDATTPGISDLARNATVLQASMPVAGGRGFVMLERVALDAGRFRTGSDGLQHDEFGTCALEWQNVETGVTLPRGCPGALESDLGYAAAAGWANDHWALDLGHSPIGFTVGNWLGGVAYSGDWSHVGYTLTLSRRPMDNTLLSYAGVVDPLTGIRYGGVTANGMTLGLSYDRGGSGGVWGEFQEQRLLGRNTPSNDRFRAMAGYYYRLVDRTNEAMRLGVTLMYWHYQRDLGEYTLAQGGYYSPQQYYSFGIPFRWSRRTGNWSLNLESSVGWSFARFSSTALYPANVLERVLGPAVDPADYQLVSGTLVQPGSRSNGVGVHVAADVERRLSGHWVLGGQVSYDHSQDFAPSSALIYVRYRFHDWQGDLSLPVEPITPYADFR